MIDQGWKLKDRTVLLLGPPSVLQQAIARRLTEFGADVALINHESKGSQRGNNQDSKVSEKFASQLMDQREVNDNFGRATFIRCDFSEPSSLKEAVSRTAESFGGVDALIDSRLPFLFIETNTEENIKQAESFIRESLIVSSQITQAVLEFFRGRKRGRIVNLVSEAALRSPLAGETFNAMVHSAILGYSGALAREVRGQNVTVNCVSVGLTEEYVVSRYPNTPSVNQAKELLLKNWPQARLIDADEVAQVVCFLISPFSNAIHGETLHL